MEDWRGTCQLKTFIRTQDIEFPVPHSVFEVVYSPVPNPQSPNYTPPDARVEVKALGKYEDQLQQHVAQYQQVACEQTIKAGCSYNPVVTSFPEFVPDESATGSTGAEGCARIEDYGVEGAPTAGESGSETLATVFQFGLNMSVPDDAMNALAAEAARQLLADNSVECVAVVGQAAAGETPGIGEIRAENVKRLMVRQGVPAHRMMTVAAGVPLFGAGAERPEPKAQDRRVLLKIVLRRQQ